MCPSAVPGSGTDGLPAGVAGVTDCSVRVTVPSAAAEIAGAVLMDLLGPFEIEDHTPPPPFPAPPPVATGGLVPTGGPGDASGNAVTPVTLVFYPPEGTLPSEAEVLEALPEEIALSGRVRVETQAVVRDWINGWKAHFRPIVIGEVRIRPPWEAPAGAESRLADVVINPGLGFGTGLHPTTRGTLELLQAPGAEGGMDELVLGPLVDAGTGSGILAIAAAKLGWGPVFAFDNDQVALISARENVDANGVAGVVEIHQAGVEGASAYWFSGATVLANMTLDPVLALIKRLSRRRDDWSSPALTQPPERLIVSGILAGAQEQELRGMARLGGYTVGRTRYEEEWVTLELLPAKPAGPAGPGWS